MSRRHRVSAPAKLNLRLRILAREDSGYHQLETLFAVVEWGDRMTVSWDPDGDRVELQVHGADTGPREDNLALRAARRFLEASGGGGGLHLELEKRIPVGGGLGGGSSDAGILLRLLEEITRRSVPRAELLRIAADLGSDVPFFLSHSPFTLAWGRGNRLCPLPPPPPAPVLLALPPVEVGTGWAYGLVDPDRREGSRPGVLDPERLSGWEGVAEAAGNDFEEVVLPHHPVLRAVREALDASGARFALLSGSGSSLYAVFDEEAPARRAERALARRFPEVRFVLTRTLARFPQLE